MDPESERSPSPESSSPDHKRVKRVGQFDLGNNKICIVIRCGKFHSSGEHYIEYRVFVIDLGAEIAAANANVSDVNDDKMVRTLTPIIQINYGLYEVRIRDAFCVVGKTLYMFEGNFDREGYESKKAVFSFDLSQVSDIESRTTTAKYLKSNLQKICDMHSPKPNPRAIPSPDGNKIVIFPSGYFHHGCDLFCPNDKKLSCQPLPDVPMPDLEFRLYGFISSSKLMLETCYEGFYVLDLDSPKEWVHHSSVLGGIERLFVIEATSPFEMVDDRFCFVTNGGAFDIKDYVGLGDFQDECFSDLGFIDRKPHGVLRELYKTTYYRLNTYFVFLDRDKENNRYNFCQLMLHPAFLLISVCYIDIEKYMVDPEARKEDSTEVVTRIKVALDAGFPELYFDSAHLISRV